ncbi:hypothetical protein HDU79_006418 [Rhizoclosmatium sp. JEL0117]|nr:hypothetical protein HDU79_006418 [Rhizoclosmatium sp. JEL0117]
MQRIAYDLTLSTVTDSQAWTQIKCFEATSPLLFQIIINFLSPKICDFKFLEDEIVALLITRCLAFLPCSASHPKWITTESQSNAQTVLSILSQRHFSNLRAPLSPPTTPEDSLLQIHAARILSTQVKPYFAKSTDQLTALRTPKQTLGKAPKPKHIVGQVFETQPWKSDFPECVLIFESLIARISSIPPSLQNLIIPTILTLIDDYEPTYKIRGLTLLPILLPKLSPESLRATNLGTVFQDSLRVCLTYHSTPPVLSAAFLATPPLLKTLYPTKSSLQTLHASATLLFREGILRGLPLTIGGTLAQLRTILSAIPEFIPLLGAHTVLQHLAPLIHYLCEVLEIHTSDTDTQILAARGLLAVIRGGGWPRIGVYHDVVVKAVAGCWMEVIREEEVEKRDTRRVWTKGDDDKAGMRREELKGLLQEVVKVLDGVCGDVVKADFEVLVKLDKELFGPLIPESAMPQSA